MMRGAGGSRGPRMEFGMGDSQRRGARSHETRGGASAGPRPEERQGRIRLRRDGQQWEFDRVVKETGRVFHFQPSGRGGLPPSVRMHAMISKHVG